MAGQLNGHFFMCTETSPRCFVIQKLDASTITQKTLSNVAKNLPQNNGNDQYQVDPSNPPFPNLPYWFNDEIERNLIQISEGLPPSSNYNSNNNNNNNNQQSNDNRKISSIPNIQITEDNNENIKLNSENKKSLEIDKKITDQKSETNITEDDKDKELEEKLRIQLEYYFSRENLATDKYLKGQMDSEGYVPIKIIANFRKVSALTNDIDLIVKVLKDSNMLQVDKNCEKVRVGAKRSTLILREITENNGEDMVKELLKGGPEWKRICYASNNSWYVTYDDDESCGKACLVIQEQAKRLGKDISVRIKTGGVPIHHENHHSSSSNVSTTASGNITTNNNTFVNGNINSYLNPLSIIPYSDNFLIPSQCQNYSPIGKNNYEGMNFINKNYCKPSINNGYNCGNKSNINTNFGLRGSNSPRRLSPLQKNNYGKKHNLFSPSKQIEKMDLGPILTLSGFYPTAAYKPSTEGLREIPLPPNPNIFMNSGQHYRNNKNSINIVQSGGHNITNNNRKTLTNENGYGKRTGTYKGSQHYNYNNQLSENTKNNIGNFQSFVKHNNNTNFNNSNIHQQNNFNSSDNKNNHQFSYNNNKSNNSFNDKNYRNYGKVTLYNNGFRGISTNTVPNYKGKGNNFNSGNESYKKYNNNYEKSSSNKNKKEVTLDLNNEKNDEIPKKVQTQKNDEDNNKVFWRIKDSNDKTKDLPNKFNSDFKKKSRNLMNSGKSSNDVDIFKIPEEGTKTFAFEGTKNSENISPNTNDKVKGALSELIKNNEDNITSKPPTPKPIPKYNFNEGEFPVLCEVTEKLVSSSLNNKNQKKVNTPNSITVQFSDIASGKSKISSSPDENIDEGKNTVNRKSYAETLLVDKN
ncbi:La-related protein CG11505 [Strongyloides ratti]|uniref:La-related protein CG11505 n=1 Tax=Strongyloides ratti TaxID=34506 RepID=A0A090MXW9_STRRB|nr:La-related protein CG11505 [Strongyloides ratti]CEF66164.1 La-related protein CG11505 [Strongyloides ratti]